MADDHLRADVARALERQGLPHDDRAVDAYLPAIQDLVRGLAEIARLANEAAVSLDDLARYAEEAT